MIRMQTKRSAASNDFAPGGGAIQWLLILSNGEAAKRARYRYSCFEHFSEDTQAYGYATSFGLSSSCEREVIEQLIELRRRAADSFEIVEEGNQKTLLRFRSPMLPELVDGIV